LVYALDEQLAVSAKATIAGIEPPLARLRSGVIAEHSPTSASYLRRVRLALHEQDDQRDDQEKKIRDDSIDEQRPQVRPQRPLCPTDMAGSIWIDLNERAVKVPVLPGAEVDASDL
jgi:hypothetical protein